MNWLIAARSKCPPGRLRKATDPLRELEAIQGAGGGGILALSNIILSDLIPLKERGVYNGLIAL